ncbi:MAG TPA: helix-turn-helix transcriptional regulator [Acidobacteriota bacterium]|nr:helix-turn-helix transcriptional regulator [Acidobacteriota bacterium]
MNSKGPINNFVCKNLRQIRIGKGIKVLDVARKTGIPASSYSCLEWGRYKLNLDNLFRILHAIDADITDVWPMAHRQSREAVTKEHIRKVLEASEDMRPPSISTDDFIQAVCDFCGVQRIDRDVARNSKEIREIQVLASIVVREVPQITLTSLSHRLDVNISSLSHRTRRMLKQAKRDEAVAERIERTREGVLELLPTEPLAKAS